ncbi:MAG TPA: META domain-containing protein, partial [Thermomicrobiales bacterium]|nr:META domain-containing protein [Thermomicrobiales bacterium]
ALVTSTTTTMASGSPVGRGGLIGGTWALVSMATADGTVSAPTGLVNYTLRLADDGSSLGLTADCNTGGGSYSLDDDTLTISHVITTLIACRDGSGGSQFARMLDGVHTISWNGEHLILTSADGAKITLAPALSAATWQWLPDDGGQLATPAAADLSRYTITFGDDGSLSVTADCNKGNSSYLTNGDQIAIRGIALTRAYCPQGSLGGQFAARIETATAYTIGNGQLTLTTPAGDLVFSAQATREGGPATPVNGPAPAATPAG